MKKLKKIWLLYDARYRYDEDAACLFEVCESLNEAKRSAPDYGNDTVIVEGIDDGKYIKDTKIIT